jgi:hypothetical protein
MQRAALLLALVTLFATSDVVTAQERPNFAGKWTGATAGQGGRGGFAGLGDAATIAQDSATITVTRTTQMGEVRSVYNLDGSERRSTLELGEYSIPLRSTTKWEGGKLVITTVFEANDQTFQTSMTLALEADGSLTVVQTSPDFANGGAATTTTRKYTKS